MLFRRCSCDVSVDAVRVDVAMFFVMWQNDTKQDLESDIEAILDNIDEMGYLVQCGRVNP